MALNDNIHPRISVFHRSIAAAGASVVSAVIVNPLDVVKVRLHNIILSEASATNSALHVPAIDFLNRQFMLRRPVSKHRPLQRLQHQPSKRRFSKNGISLPAAQRASASPILRYLPRHAVQRVSRLGTVAPGMP